MENQETQGPIENAQIVQMISTRALMSAQKELTDFLLDEKRTQRFIDAAKKMKDIAIRLTNPEDWVIFGESMHLQERRLVEISAYLQTLMQVNIQFLPTTVTIDEYKQIVNQTKLDENKSPLKDSSGKYLTEEIEIDVREYICTGGIMVEELQDGKTVRKRIIQPISGSASTADQLWAKRNGLFLDPNQVQPSLIRKKAEANYRGNCLRLLWGLKGITLAELKEAFGDDISRLADSTRRGAKQQQSPEAVKAIEKLWTRVLTTFDGKAEAAKAWLKTVTSFSAGTNKSTGQAYQGFDGYTDIYRVKPESKSFTKIQRAVEKCEAEKGAAATGTEAKEAGSIFLSKKSYKRHCANLENAKSADTILNIEKQIAKDQTLSLGHLTSLNDMATVRFQEFEEQKNN